MIRLMPSQYMEEEVIIVKGYRVLEDGTFICETKELRLKNNHDLS